MFQLTNKFFAFAVCLSGITVLSMAKPAFALEDNTSCGGILNVGVDRPATIKYKLNEEYSNNELCVWTIRVDDEQSSSLHFVKKESKFELRFDFLQLSSFRHQNLVAPNQTKTFGNVNDEEEVTMAASVVFVVFSTDDSETGTGFSLEIEVLGSPGYNYSRTNYFSVEEVGSTSLRPYEHRMFSTYIISPTNVEALELEVIYDTEADYDKISVFHCERNGGRILFFPYGVLSGFGSRLYTVNVYTTFVVLFSSDGSGIRQGFDLNWKPVTESGSTQGYLPHKPVD